MTKKKSEQDLTAEHIKITDISKVDMQAVADMKPGKVMQMPDPNLSLLGPKAILEIKVKVLEHGSDMPLKATPGSAAFDLCAAIPEPLYIENLVPLLIPTGLQVEIPAGYCGLLLPRSGMATKQHISLANSPGLIDSDYRGEIFVALKLNQDWRKLGVHAPIYPGDRIAQLLIMPVPAVEFIQVEKLSNTERAEGGFGSTGKGDSLA